jgi:hypothetical protein
MELSIDPGTEERIAWGACGVLSFIALIAWCRWQGTPEDQREVTPPELPKRERPSTPLNTNVIDNDVYVRISEAARALHINEEISPDHS